MRWNIVKKKKQSVQTKIIQRVNNKRTRFCWVQRKSKPVWRMFTFFVVGFVNNSNFFIFLEKKKISKVCVHLFCIAQKMFSFNIAKWVCDIADCCYHDASCMLWKKKKGKKKRSRKRRKAQTFCTGCLYVWEELPKINKDTVVNTQRKLWSHFCNFLYMFTREQNPLINENWH